MFALELEPISPPTTQLCIKCADLSSLGAANGVYRKWVYRLEDEVRRTGRTTLRNEDKVRGPLTAQDDAFFALVA